ncbi:MAG TPA: helix-turn-helix domain-containing protein [Flavisolibacter sp.]|nr:helix-turn-helix domain-containing protein [Flavisolibacter sp.]
MEMDIVTRADLIAFRTELLNDIREMLFKKEGEFAKPWLRNEDVCRLLAISPSTLKRLRISGKVLSSKVGGIHYYEYRKIEKLLSDNQNLKQNESNK